MKISFVLQIHMWPIVWFFPSTIMMEISKIHFGAFMDIGTGRSEGQAGPVFRRARNRVLKGHFFWTERALFGLKRHFFDRKGTFLDWEGTFVDEERALLLRWHIGDSYVTFGHWGHFSLAPIPPPFPWQLAHFFAHVSNKNKTFV